MRKVWIAWETQRRSLSLSKKLGAEFRAIEVDRPGALRYLVSCLKTLPILFRYRGQIVIVQNPSLFLAVFAALCKPLLGYRLVVDRHSNFLLGQRAISEFRRRVFHALSRFSIRRADLTIVTNTEILDAYIAPYGRGFVLPDPYPDIPRKPVARGGGKELEALFVSTWHLDEPVEEMVEACRRLEGRVKVHISGKMKERYRALVATAPANFIPTGFLPDEEYFDLMRRVDCVVAISKWPSVLVCGAYEGISLGKPVIVGDSKVSRDYFSAGVVYTTGTVEDLAAKLDQVARELPRLEKEVGEFYVRSSRAWEERLASLEAAIRA